jgi:predicted nuclease of predicted toxin-antitoxin system
MRFLTDQDVYATTVRFLSGLGHEVVPVAQLGLAQADDVELLRVAQEQGRLFVTRDRDFGGLVFVRGCGTGVLYLRILPSTQDAVHAELARVLTLYSEGELRQAFLVVEPGRHRMRRVGPAPEQQGESHDAEDHP